MRCVRCCSPRRCTPIIIREAGRSKFPNCAVTCPNRWRKARRTRWSIGSQFCGGLRRTQMSRCSARHLCFSRKLPRARKASGLVLRTDMLSSSRMGHGCKNCALRFPTPSGRRLRLGSIRAPLGRTEPSGGAIDRRPAGADSPNPGSTAGSVAFGLVGSIGAATGDGDRKKASLATTDLDRTPTPSSSTFANRTRGNRTANGRIPELLLPSADVHAARLALRRPSPNTLLFVAAGSKGACNCLD